MLLKLLLWAAVMALAAVHLLKSGPALRAGGRTPAGALTLFAGLLRLEAALLAGVLVTTGVLTTLAPASTPGQALRRAFRLQLGEIPVIFDMTPTQGPWARFRVVLPAGFSLPEGAQARLSLSMPDHAMGRSVLILRQDHPRQFSGLGAINMAGRWEARLDLVAPGLPEPASAVVRFDAPSAVDPQRVRGVALRLAWWDARRALRSTAGLALVGAGLAVTWRSRTGRLSDTWLVGSLPAMAAGAGLLASVVWAELYPTSLVRNPVPRTAPLLREAHGLYLQHCASCHGPQGRGDGPAGALLNPRPSDLTDPHMDRHLDGDLYWWISKGIAGSAMPSWEGTLTDQERWALVHYLRALRDTPPGRRPWEEPLTGPAEASGSEGGP